MVEKVDQVVEKDWISATIGAEAMSATNLLSEYEARYEAMFMLYEIVDGISDPKIGLQMRHAIEYLRETAMDSLPWGDVVPNKTYHRSRFGRLVGWAG